ncbi:ecdysteroid 22-kinase family protein [Sneathiella marina]|uniref:Ecdysteroid 22-kinase family protein n=1 Tax=Sneathiella marina TaxID=2950108 RepID=A0ABY4W1R7_9PROT|nr:ecdysteroid 22-kinase family protein [Sneathiella marina]USG61023.1 ecdysteroid 22-kinase family protein [Sneathiella marina]
MTVSIPRSVEEITPQWFEEIVFPNSGFPHLSRITKTNVGEGRGFLSQTFKVGLQFEDTESNTAPKSVIVKLQPTSGLYQATANELHAFLREVSFYRDVAPTAPLRLPEIYFADATAGAGALVMEDLGSLASGDQILGIEHSQAVTTAREIAKIHAAYWNSPKLENLDWAPARDHFNSDHYAEYWPKFAKAHGTVIGAEALSIGAKVAKNIDWLEEKIASRPRSIIHGDLRADNLMFSRETGGNEVVILDWQLVTKNLGTIDIARLLGGSEPILQRQGHQMEIVHAWYDSLVESGVTDYSRSEAEDDFRLGILHCLLVPVRIFSTGKGAISGRRQQLLDTIISRFFSAALELNAGSVFPD